jgi:steroid delta-isomerase-like uncharacterized protein
MTAEQSTAANKAVIERLSEELWNRQNLAIVDELVAPEWVDHDAAQGMPPGPAGLKALAAGMQAAFSNGRSTIEDMVAGGDRVAWRWTYRSRHTGEFQGIPPSGNEVALTGITIDRIADGKLVERWGMVDTLGFLQQLGAIPAPREA